MENDFQSSLNDIIRQVAMMHGGQEQQPLGSGVTAGPQIAPGALTPSQLTDMFQGVPSSGMQSQVQQGPAPTSWEARPQNPNPGQPFMAYQVGDQPWQTHDIPQRTMPPQLGMPTGMGGMNMPIPPQAPTGEQRRSGEWAATKDLYNANVNRAIIPQQMNIERSRAGLDTANKTSLINSREDRRAYTRAATERTLQLAKRDPEKWKAIALAQKGLSGKIKDLRAQFAVADDALKTKTGWLWNSSDFDSAKDKLDKIKEALQKATEHYDSILEDMSNYETNVLKETEQVRQDVDGEDIAGEGETYSDAKLAEDGHRYVNRNGQWYRVKE